MIQTTPTQLLVVSSSAPIVCFFSPTWGLVTALVIMYAFDIFCGMRADGIEISHGDNFSFKKLGNATKLLLLYLVILQVLYSVVKLNGNPDAGLLATKSLNYVFLYVYLQNSFKNLRKAYPKNKHIIIAYYLIRFEFTKALPGNVQDIIEKIEKDEQRRDN